MEKASALIRITDVHSGETQLVTHPMSVWEKIARLGNEISHNEVFVPESQTIAEIVRVFPEVFVDME
jgi:hypothetical protein